MLERSFIGHLLSPSGRPCRRLAAPLEPAVRARRVREVSRLVMKFGGTSVADLERIRRVAALVAAEVAYGRRVAVIVSAMAGKTNELVAWTDGAGSPDPAL